MRQPMCSTTSASKWCAAPAMRSWRSSFRSVWATPPLPRRPGAGLPEPAGVAARSRTSASPAADAATGDSADAPEEQIILRPGMKPIKARKIRWYEEPAFISRHALPAIPELVSRSCSPMARPICLQGDGNGGGQSRVSLTMCEALLLAAELLREAHHERAGAGRVLSASEAPRRDAAASAIYQVSRPCHVVREPSGQSCNGDAS
jgi:hypothetical protein